KAINDKYGHDAGDEIIISASQCILNAFGKYGHVYRLGGDEFAATLNVSSEEFETAKEAFEVYVKEWHGEHDVSFHVSLGEASKREFPDATIHELSKISDKRMYDFKNKYYSANGVERRDLQKAYISLVDLYEHVLKVDLNDESYQPMGVGMISPVENEKLPKTFTKWVAKFAKECDMSDYDKAKLKDGLAVKKIIKNLENRKAVYLEFARKINGVTTKLNVVIVPTKDYEDSNRIAYVFIRNGEQHKFIGESRS
ncbi:MAG: GGDEF domain-containing protein, partial [Bacilli bacterium]|nr:GGDEF domain-containing protein [Bacilli bacterium]